jgi:transposase
MAAAENGIGAHLQERRAERRLLVLGPTAVVRYVRNKPNLAGCINALLARRPARVVTVAVANKRARIVWAIMQRGGTFRERPFGIT